MSDKNLTPTQLAALYGERQKRFQDETDRLSALSRTIGNLRGLSFGALVVSGILVLIGQSPQISTWTVASCARAAPRMRSSTSLSLPRNTGTPRRFT